MFSQFSYIGRQHVPCTSSALLSLLGSEMCLFFKGLPVVVETGWRWQEVGHGSVEWDAGSRRDGRVCGSRTLSKSAGGAPGGERWASHAVLEELWCRTQAWAVVSNCTGYEESLRGHRRPECENRNCKALGRKSQNICASLV